MPTVAVDKTRWKLSTERMGHDFHTDNINANAGSLATKSFNFSNFFNYKTQKILIEIKTANNFPYIICHFALRRYQKCQVQVASNILFTVARHFQIDSVGHCWYMHFDFFLLLSLPLYQFIYIDCDVCVSESVFAIPLDANYITSIYDELTLSYYVCFPSVFYLIPFAAHYGQ